MATIPVPSSAVAGYLGPAAVPAPLEGDALDDLFHDVTKGILGAMVTDALVRPRWQPEPPNQPSFSTDWVAFGVQVSHRDWMPYQAHDPAANEGYGANILQRGEELTLMHSYYGPNSWAMQARYQDGIMLSQNRATLDANGIKLVECQRAYPVPALLKERWVKKVDQRIVFRRTVLRVYPILTIVAANIDLDNEHYHTIIVVPPP